MTTNMSLKQVRVIDPVLSTVAIGYSNQAFIGQRILPRVPVFAAGGQILQFGKEAFLKYNLRRAPGTKVARIALGYLGAPYALVQDALEVPIPFEHQRDASVVLGLNLQTRATKKGMEIALKSLESDIALLVTTAANYAAGNKVTLAGGTKWSSTGTPVTDFDTAREAIRSQVGIYPNTAWFSAVAWTAFKNNAQVTDRFKYTNADGIITPDMVKDLLGVSEIAIGQAVQSTDAGVMSDVWGNFAGLAYVPPSPEDADTPGFGFTYTLDGDPRIEEAYYDHTAKAWIVPVTYERAPVLAAPNAGYLFTAPN